VRGFFATLLAVKLLNWAQDRLCDGRCRAEASRAVSEALSNNEMQQTGGEGCAHAGLVPCARLQAAPPAADLGVLRTERLEGWTRPE
jgi:hypothetical protein